MNRRILVYILLNCVALCSYSQAKITVVSDYFSKNDTLELQVFNEVIGFSYNNPYRTFKSVPVRGKSTFTIDSVTDWSRVSLNFSYQKRNGLPGYGILSDFPVEKDDNVIISVKPVKGFYLPLGGGFDGDGGPIFLRNWHCKFSGKGANKYMVRYNVLSFTRGETRENLGIDFPYVSTIEKARAKFHQIDSLLTLSFNYIHEQRHLLNEKQETLIKMDAIGSFGYTVCRIFEELHKNIEDKLPEKLTEVKIYADEYMQKIEKEIERNKKYIVISPSFISYYNRFLGFTYSMDNRNYNPEKLYDYIKLSVTDEFNIKDWVLMNMLRVRYKNVNTPEFYERIMSGLKDPYCRIYMQRLGAFTRGKKALNFSLPDLKDKYHSLDSLLGKVVFVDFWYLSCLACRIYKQEVLQPMVQYLKDRDDIVFITVSIDTKETFLEAIGYTDFLPEGSLHLYTDGQTSQHPIIKNYGISGYPSPMLIDKKGNIRYTSELRKLDKFKEALSELLAE